MRAQLSIVNKLLTWSCYVALTECPGQAEHQAQHSKQVPFILLYLGGYPVLVLVRQPFKSWPREVAQADLHSEHVKQVRHFCCWVG